MSSGTQHYKTEPFVEITNDTLLEKETACDNDATENISSEELKHLRQVFSAASDYRKGRGWPDFADQYGGQERLEQDLIRVTGLLEQWYAEGGAE